AVVGLIDAAAGKDEFAGHEHHLVVSLADENFWDGGGAIDEDQRGGVYRAAIGVMIGFFSRLFSVAHCAPAAGLVFVAETVPLLRRILFVKSVHAQRPLH